MSPFETYMVLAYEFQTMVWKRIDEDATYEAETPADAFNQFLRRVQGQELGRFTEFLVIPKSPTGRFAVSMTVQDLNAPPLEVVA